ncbi:hypothetical protein SLEP1_g25330 [Rubroshorea leprosula]|uniref:Uncharacterized protein n=1 Tax=Rubroshorea leprosula TaxID=152421 RepID=A0AAV5JSB1_9ROSI|nr:hypothetical protein SLEP1_g25330 [Rubroshorea leprosula]
MAVSGQPLAAPAKPTASNTPLLPPCSPSLSPPIPSSLQIPSPRNPPLSHCQSSYSG